MARGLADLTRAELARIVPELLLCGHLIDRAGMPHLLGAFGLPGMRDIAIEEWKGASPHYTMRMQRALGYEGQGVVTIFKGLQLDVGAPPQFLDFRFTVHDEWSGTFALAHCGALMDVEPMGEEYVEAMCHEIEDPTMDATALATDPRARMRPVHRPPRTPADRTPHCEWVVDIDESRDPIEWPDYTLEVGATAAARFADVTTIDPADEGAADYAGPIVSDVDFEAFSRSALVRVAEEVMLQWHLLVLSFVRSLTARGTAEQAAEITRRQFTGVAGVTSERLCRALGLGQDLEAVAAVLSVHPAFGPRGYVDLRLSRDADALVVHLSRGCPAQQDGAWVSLLDVEHLEPVEAILHAVHPTWHAEVVEAAEDALRLRVVRGVPSEESSDVGLVRFSKGADFTFERRRSLPLTVVPDRRTTSETPGVGRSPNG
jgi:hypothetical protein